MNQDLRLLDQRLENHPGSFMSLENLSVTLQVWSYAGRPPKSSEFLDRLIVDGKDGVRKCKSPRPRVDLLSIRAEDFSDEEEPSEAFVAGLESQLTRSAKWLHKQPVTLFNELRSAGYTTELLFSGWIDSDQLDLYLPPALLKACGRLGLRISIITND